MYRRQFFPPVAAVLGAICAIWAPVRCVSAAPSQAPAKPIIAVFQLSGQLAEQPADDSSQLFGQPASWLRDVVMRMKTASEDPEVKAVVVLSDQASFGLPQAEELRQAMQGLQAAGKEVYAHSDSMMLGQYILLCGASRLSVAPTGDVWVTGLHGDAPYLRGLLDKLNIQADILHCGAYKSAGEMFMRDGPSPEAEQNVNWLLDSLFDRAIDVIAAGRHVAHDQAKTWIDRGPYTAEKAKAAGMIDAVEVRADFEAMLKDKFGPDSVFEKHYGEPKKPQLDLSNPFALIRSIAELAGAKEEQGAKKAAVGVVYVDGIILPGKSDPSPFGGNSGAYSSDIADALDQATRDDSVKAVVLRIDSPGGSALASEIILQATMRVKDKKPLVVSMGDVAGSGGYYVACGADTIFADPATITGSIGVVGGKFITTAMWNSIGVTWKSYQRGENAGLLSSDSDFTPAQRDRMQSLLDEIYGVFKNHVTAIRGNRLKKPIDDLAGGRVYTGQQALDLGLVDKMGSLRDAVEFAAAQAKLTDYDVRTVPEPKNFMERLMEQAGGGNDDPQHLGAASAPSPMLGANSLIKMAAPYLSEVDPEHVRLIQAALSQLQLIQNEGAVLLMPANFREMAMGHLQIQ
jgi:protease IV